MSDLALIWDAKAGSADLSVEAGVLATDAGLRTAVVVSLFTDRLARADDVLPVEDGDRRGWWGDVEPRVAGDRIGSRLWLLAREKATPQALNRAREYAAEALNWLIADGVARTVEVEAEAQGSVLGLGLVLRVVIIRTGGAAGRYALTWSATR